METSPLLESNVKDRGHLIDHSDFESGPPPLPENLATFSVSGMTCASCVATLEHAISQVPKVQRVAVDLLSQKAKVWVMGHATTDLIDRVCEAVSDVGYSAKPLEKQDPQLETSEAVAAYERVKEVRNARNSFLVSLIFAIPAFLVGMVFSWIPALSGLFHRNVVPGLSIRALVLLVLSTPVQFWLGRSFHIGAWKALRHRAANMDTLVSLGTNAAYFYSLIAVIVGMIRPDLQSDTFFEASVLLISFVLLGRFLEQYAKGKTSSALTQLLQMKPAECTRVELGKKEGVIVSEERINASLVEPGDVLRVIPGERIATDGEVVRGSSEVDESMVTGESLPISKHRGSQVIGGTVNQSGVLLVRATRVGRDTVLARIIGLVEEAQVSKAPIQKLADRVSGVFVPIVMIVSLVTFIIWISLTATPHPVVPSTWLPKDTNPVLFSFTFAIAVLVIACPCSLGLATPTAVMVGTGIGAQLGILIKGGEVLERAHTITAVVFDKTGTLTHGKPRVTDSMLISKQLSWLDVWYFVAVAEAGSEHPLGKALYDHAKEQMSTNRLEEAVDFRAVAGKGVYCRVGSTEVHIGNRCLMQDFKVPLETSMDDSARSLEAEGKTVMFVALDQRVCALVGVADTVRDEAAKVLHHLQDTMGVSVWMVTGDNFRTASAIAKKLGISQVFSEVLPDFKRSKVMELQQQGYCVAMVGDGINDSPALVQADVGLAIGTGTDVAMEAADMVLMKSDLRHVVTAFDLSRKTYNRIRINFLWAFLYNSVGIPLAAGVLYAAIRPVMVPPAVAGLAMALSSVSVIGSSLLLKLYKPPF